MLHTQITLIFQIEFQAFKGDNEFGFVAVDDVVFVEIPKCDFLPKEATPTAPPTPTTTPITASTPVPSTEPPNPIIFCSWEEDYCKWNRIPNTVNATSYGWKRMSVNEIENQAIPGPPTDPLEGKDGKFVIASNFLSKDTPKGRVGRIASPYLIGTEHPNVCFTFLAYLGVSARSLINRVLSKFLNFHIKCVTF